MHADPATTTGCAAGVLHTLIAVIIVTLAWSGATTAITPLAVLAWACAAALVAIEAALYITSSRSKNRDQ